MNAGGKFYLIIIYHCDTGEEKKIQFYLLYINIFKILF